MSEKKRIPLTIMAIGEYSVGKTSLLLRFCTQEFHTGRLTIPLNLIIRTVVINDNTIDIVVFDTAMCEKYDVIPHCNIRGVSGIVLVYDITNRRSFNRIEFWYNTCNDIANNSQSFVLAGLKSELSDEREVKKEEGEALALKYGIPFFEVSSIENQNVEDVFLNLLNIIMEKKN